VVELIADHSRLHPDAAVPAVQRNDFVEMLGNIHHQTTANALPSKRSSGSARDETESVAVGEADDFPQVVLGFREDHARRHFLIFRGVGGIEAAQGAAGVEFT